VSDLPLLEVIDALSLSLGIVSVDLHVLNTLVEGESTPLHESEGGSVVCPTLGLVLIGEVGVVEGGSLLALHVGHSELVGLFHEALHHQFHGHDLLGDHLEFGEVSLGLALVDGELGGGRGGLVG